MPIDEKDLKVVELNSELQIRKLLENEHERQEARFGLERKLSNGAYAMKVTEYIVFGAVGTVALYFLNKALGLFNIVIPHP